MLLHTIYVLKYSIIDMLLFKSLFHKYILLDTDHRQDAVQIIGLNEIENLSNRLKRTFRLETYSAIF